MSAHAKVHYVPANATYNLRVPIAKRELPKIGLSNRSYQFTIRLYRWRMPFLFL